MLSGAGISTESGIPDYRGPGTTTRRAAPMTIDAFVSGPGPRRRYWARAHLGWARFADVAPNAGHDALARLEAAGLVRGVVTQNVDGLHQRAGSRCVVDLHGRLDRVVCLDCGAVVARADVHRRLAAANADWDATAAGTNPDGDVDLDDASVAGFVVVSCEQCGGVLKPDVVYFGERVPPERVAAAADLVDGARSLLVVGSSLHVFSGRRIVHRAAAAGRPVAIVNLGPTRSDDRAQVRVDAPLGRTLTRLLDDLGLGSPTHAR